MPKQYKDEEQVSDRELIKHIQKDDMDAWNALMRRYSERAFQIAYGVLGQRDDAEEVVQDAFVRIYRALDKFRGDSEFSTWMFRIVVNQARNKYRWNKRRGSQVNISIDKPLDEEKTGSLSLDVPDGQKAPDEQFVFNEWKSEIAREMEQLPTVNREALILRNVHNMSYEQIAEVLDCKVGTIKSRIARAREELRRRLGL